QAAVDLHAADTRQVVGFLAVEQTLEQRFDGLFGGRFARTHHAIDGYAGSHLVGGLVSAQCLRNVRATVQIVGVDGLNLANIGRTQILQHRLGDFVVGVGNDFAGFGVDDVFGQHAANQEV